MGPLERKSLHVLLSGSGSFYLASKPFFHLCVEIKVSVTYGEYTPPHPVKEKHAPCLRLSRLVACIRSE